MKQKYKNYKRYIKPAQAKLAYFPSKPIKVNKYEILRNTAKDLDPVVQLRLERIIFYETVGEYNVTKTTKHFGISRKTFHKWYKRFKDSRYRVKSLCNESKAPKRKRKWEVSYEEEDRVIYLRKETKCI